MKSINKAFPKKKVSADILEGLAHALKNLENYLEPDNKQCSVSPEAREASKLYLDTWVRSYIVMVLCALTGDQDSIEQINDFARQNYFDKGFDRLEELI